jgi:hypothetical protein
MVLLRSLETWPIPTSDRSVDFARHGTLARSVGGAVRLLEFGDAFAHLRAENGTTSIGPVE